MIRTLIFLVLTSLITACASTSTGSSFKQSTLANDGTSIVYIYRLDLGYFNQNAVDLNVFLDGKLISELPKDGYIPVKISAGSHLISFSFYGNTPTSTERIEIEANKEYFVKLNDLREQGVLVTKTLNQVSLVNADVGMREIASTKLVSGFNSSVTY